MNYKKKSKKQEKSVAKDVEGSINIASGSLWFQKGDVKNDRFLFECKVTEKDYFTISAKIWSKLKQQAVKSSLREPVLVIDFKDGIYRYAVISLPTLFSLNISERDLMIIDLVDEKDKTIKSFKLDYKKLLSISLEVVETKNKTLIYTFNLQNDKLCVVEWEDFVYFINKGGNR